MSGIDPNNAGVIVVGGGGGATTMAELTDVGAAGLAVGQAATAATARSAIGAAGATAGLLSARPASASEGEAYYATDSDEAFFWRDGGWTYPSGQPVEAMPVTPILWLRADLGVTESGGAVSSWASQGSVTASATQGTGSAQPTLVRGALNGRPAITFDGGDYLEIAYNASLDPASALTLVVVCRSTADNAVIVGRPYAAAHTSPYFEWLFYDQVSNKISLRVGASDVEATNVNAAGDNAFPIPSLYSYTCNASARVVRRNGAQLGSALSGGTLSYTNNRGIRIGANAAGSENLNGLVAEVILFDSVLSAANLAIVERTLAARYGFGLWGQ